MLALGMAAAGGRAAGETPAQVSRLLPGEEAVRQAIIDAVRSRMGSTTDVRIDRLQLGRATSPGAAEDRLSASPEPGARAGRPVRFSLSWRRSAAVRPAPAGYAVATVAVTADHARAARAIARGETLRAEDVAATRAEVGGVLLQRLPTTDEVVGTRVLRDVLPQEVLTHALVVVRPMVQSGDVVALCATADGVRVQAPGVAAQSGEAGDTIRVVNRESRRAVKARVIGPGTVEVIQ